MPSLRDIVAALQQELDAAFAETKPGSTGTALELEKVTLSLELDLLDKDATPSGSGIGFSILEGAKAAKSSGHRLTIELRNPASGGKHGHGSCQCGCADGENGVSL